MVFKKITKKIIFGDYKCPYCERQVPNFTLLTRNQCIWCDANYHRRKNVKITKASKPDLTTEE